MREVLCKKMVEVLEGLTCEQLQALVEVPADEKLGDYALPCFTLAKVQRKNPALIAAELAEKLEAAKEALGLARVQSVGGYCNLFVDRKGYVESGMNKMLQENLGVEQIGKGKTICMDYSSPNIAKNFHVGHLRTTVIGNSLYKIHEKLGYEVVRINYLGDWGTQFGKLITAYKKWSSKEAVEKGGIEELLRIYVKFTEEAEKAPQLIEEARAWFVKMEKNDEEALEIWNWFKEISMVEFERVYKMLGMSFDCYSGESHYRNKVSALAKELEGKGLLEESQGAKVIDLGAYDMPPCLIMKSDGGSIYHSRDIAALLDRKKKYDFSKCLYVTGMEQTLHFKQVFKAIELMGYPWYENLVHIPFGLVSLAGEKLSTRNGNIVYAEDILKEAVERAGALIEEKNPTLQNKVEVAHMVGIGAVVFHDLYNQRIKNVDFSWEDVLSFEGTTGPYVQYTYARAGSVLQKYGEVSGNAVVDYSVLTDDVTFSLVKTLLGYENAVNNAAEKYEPSVVARYLIALAMAFNRFYHECPILKASEKERQARVLLVKQVQKVLADGCGLLGLECPEEM
ncbi:MAG: arginine--tRNA ligase [Lachnospiraceae bacterium]|nr:arginine--tRNA ligase [Lachnospiraceae bacterium]